MCFSELYKEKMNILKEKSTYTKEQILVFDIQVFEKRKSDTVNFVETLINYNKDDFAILTLKQSYCQYSEFLKLHFLNFMKVLSEVVKYLAEYPEAPEHAEPGYSWEFRNLINEILSFNFYDLFSVVYGKKAYGDKDNSYCEKLRNGENLDIKEYLNYNLYINILKFYFREQKEESHYKEYLNMKNEIQQASDTIDEKNIVIEYYKEKKENNKPVKKEILPEYKNNKNPYSWNDVEIVNFESTGNFSYKTMKGLRSFELSKKRKDMLFLIIKSEGIQQGSYYNHRKNKTTFFRLKKDLMEMFNKIEEPIKWHESHRVFEIKFKFIIYPDSIDYKTTLLSSETESMLQCNPEEIED